MKRNHLLAILAAALIFSACSSSGKTTGVWVNKEKLNGKSYHNIFIVVLTGDIAARTKLENDLAAEAVSKGYQAVKSIDVMPPVLKDPKVPTKEDIQAKVKASGCDAVFVASLLRKEEDIHYIPGTTSYSIRPYYSWSGNYYGYYSRLYPTVYTPGYFTNDKSYFIQSNLYDVVTEEAMWSVQSEVFNPTSLNNFSKMYTTGLIKQLTKEKLLKK